MEEIQKTPEYAQGNPELVERHFRLMFRSYCYLPEHTDLLNLRLSPVAAVNGAKVRELLSENVFLKEFNSHDKLKQLDVPTLVIHGDFDLIPPSAAWNLSRSLRNAHYVLLEQCGHFPFVEKPEAFFAHIHKFLSQETPKSSDF